MDRNIIKEYTHIYMYITKVYIQRKYTWKRKTPGYLERFMKNVAFHANIMFVDDLLQRFF